MKNNFPTHITIDTLTQDKFMSLSGNLITMSSLVVIAFH